jgi:hypothetical protein
MNGRIKRAAREAFIGFFAAVGVVDCLGRLVVWGLS